MAYFKVSNFSVAIVKNVIRTFLIMLICGFWILAPYRIDMLRKQFCFIPGEIEVVLIQEGDPSLNFLEQKQRRRALLTAPIGDEVNFGRKLLERFPKVFSDFDLIVPIPNESDDFTMHYCRKLPHLLIRPVDYLIWSILPSAGPLGEPFNTKQLEGTNFVEKL